VLLGVGFDTRVFRLPFPSPTRVYEIDLPEIIECKEAILQDVAANCYRYAITSDLQQPWEHLLVNQFSISPVNRIFLNSKTKCHSAIFTS